MTWDWDPCSEQMGHLVDRWLQTLRQQGLTLQNCETMARRLARAIRRNAEHDTILQNFRAFVNSVK
jgi:cob(I)alamin adenosyltransferase